VLLTGEGFEPPSVAPDWGVPDRAARTSSGPTVAVLYYRAHHLAGNTAYLEALCTAIEDAGGQALPVFTASLRSVEPDLLETLGTADAMVVTVLAAGGSRPATAQALHGIAERLLEAMDRKMWESPDPELLAELRQAYLDTEGDLEGGETPAQLGR
jgi:cobalamin biosynthesis Mg chelatase CobN